jgi:hypothetical protein
MSSRAGGCNKMKLALLRRTDSRPDWLSLHETDPTATKPGISMTSSIDEHLYMIRFVLTLQIASKLNIDCAAIRSVSLESCEVRAKRAKEARRSTQHTENIRSPTQSNREILFDNYSQYLNAAASPCETWLPLTYTSGSGGLYLHLLSADFTRDLC